MLIHRR